MSKSTGSSRIEAEAVAPTRPAWAWTTFAGQIYTLNHEGFDFVPVFTDEKQARKWAKKTKLAKGCMLVPFYTRNHGGS